MHFTNTKSSFRRARTIQPLQGFGFRARTPRVRTLTVIPALNLKGIKPRVLGESYSPYI